MNPTLYSALKTRIAKALRVLFPSIVFKMPAGMTPDKAAMGGLFGLISNINEYSQAPITVATGNSTSNTISAAAWMSGIINRTGTPGGAVTDTTDTAVNIVQMCSPTMDLDGTCQMPVRYINNGTGQTITVAAGTGVTLTGTMTIANNAWRDFILSMTSPTTVTITNNGGGTL